jgi:catechol 2,3-dioxygenase-like lactoylglutathione lyase family enzyme
MRGGHGGQSIDVFVGGEENYPVMGNILGIDHTSLSVSNLDRSIAFYKRLGFEFESKSDAFGPELAEGVGVPNAYIYVAMLRHPDREFRLELIQYREPRESDPSSNDRVGSVHVSFRVRDLSQLYDQLLNEGARFVSAPQSVLWLGDRVNWVYLKDPDGITIELLEILESNKS